jgi:hypothetical protein
MSEAYNILGDLASVAGPSLGELELLADVAELREELVTVQARLVASEARVADLTRSLGASIARETQLHGLLADLRTQTQWAAAA